MHNEPALRKYGWRIGGGALAAWSALCSVWLIFVSGDTPSESEIQACLAGGVYVTRADCRHALRSPLSERGTMFVVTVWAVVFALVALATASTLPWRRIVRARAFMAFGHGALIAATALLLTALLLVTPFLTAEGENSYASAAFLVGPFVIGALVALVTGGRAGKLVVGLLSFLAIGVAELIALGPDGRAEGGFVVVMWVVAGEIVALYATAGLWWLQRRAASTNDASEREQVAG